MPKVDIDDILKAKRLPLAFRSLKREGCHAQTDFKKIEIDPKSRIPLAKLYIHEVIHNLLDKDIAEYQVDKLENEIWDKATRGQIQKLYKKIFKK